MDGAAGLTEAGLRLAAAMVELSERCWSASWRTDTSGALWSFVENGAGPWGAGVVDDEDRARLAHFAQLAGYWIDLGPRGLEVVPAPVSAAAVVEAARRVGMVHDATWSAEKVSASVGAPIGVRAVAIAENQRGELRESDVALSVTSGGGKPGQGYPMVMVGTSEATHALTGAQGFDASEDGTGRGTPIVAMSTGPAAADGVSPSLMGSTGKGGGGRKLEAAPAFTDMESGPPAEGLAPTERGRGGNSMPHVLVDETGEVVPEGSTCAFDPQPDGRRYAACGDGVAAPQATWIGLRLALVMAGEDPDRG